MPYDSQQVEILGRNLLIAELMAEGIEVATPVRDLGVDLLVYPNFRGMSGLPAAVPIQLKASIGRSFGLRNHYHGIQTIKLVYAWKVDDPAAASFRCMTYSEALGVLRLHGYEQAPVWQNTGRYAVTEVGPALNQTLNKFVVSRGNWFECLFGSRAQQNA